jgi:hypothetical protein
MAVDLDDFTQQHDHNWCPLLVDPLKDGKGAAKSISARLSLHHLYHHDHTSSPSQDISDNL